MKTLKNTLFFIAIAILFSYCSDDDSSTIDPCDVSDYDERIPALIMDFTAAVQAYGADPSISNCNNLNTELNNYLNFLKDFDDCPFTVGNGVEIKDAIRETEMLIDELECS